MVALLVLAGPAHAATQPFGGLEQFPGTLGCVSESGSGGACAKARGLTGVTALTADFQSVYAVSPSQGTLVVLGADPVDGGFTERGRIRVRVRCRTESGPCRVTLAAPRARRSARIGPGRTVVRLRLALARKTRRAVHRHPRRGVRVKLTLRGRDVAGLTARTTRRVRVRARPAP